MTDAVAPDLLRSYLERVERFVRLKMTLTCSM
ncbi:hypothetical protein SAMN05519104_7839 [Rhizobiales bacterium GAS188]|nr:hypothetical protein SAMN05519104_7839 [Rhizobiales bacterium GAS188]